MKPVWSIMSWCACKQTASVAGRSARRAQSWVRLLFSVVGKLPGTPADEAPEADRSPW